MADEQNGPVFRLQKLYVKDLSFESPSAPQVFFGGEQSKIEVKLSLANRPLEHDHWEVALHINVTATAGENTVFIAEIEHAGAFLIRGVPAEHLPGLLGVDCPIILFPFTRQILCQATMDGGFPPLLLEPINFRAMFEASQAAPTRH